jgi:hypothetical protein
MLGLGNNLIHNNRIKKGGVIYDVAYQAILDYATTQGYTLPSASQRLLQEQLLIDLKDAGVWSKLDTFAVFANDGNSNFALIDWIRTVKQRVLVLYTAVNSPTWTANQGFTGNGTSSYIDTNFNLLNDSVNYTDINASRYIYLFSGSNATLDGIVSSTAYNRIIISSSTQQSINSVNAASSNFSYTSTKGVKSIHRTSTNDVSLYNDKVGSTRTQLYETPLRSVTQIILRRGSSYSDNTISIYALGASLVAENDSFVDSLNTYFE